MKRNFAKILTVAALLICLLALGILAISAETEGYYTYTLRNEQAIITEVHTGIFGNIEIPETLGGYTVTSIGEYAFCECVDLTEIIIPDSVTSIGEMAFGYCSGLTSVPLAKTVN